MDKEEQRRSVEALILASPEPISAARVAEVIPYATPAKVRDRVEELNAEYAEQGRSFRIESAAGGYQMRTLPEFADLVQRLQPLRPLRLSRAALETLAIVAYRQPVTRGEIENVRGVDAGAVLKSLLERRLVRLAGHREVPGRPMLYGTSRRFLEVFGLDRLEDLPRLRDVAELAAEAGVTPPGAEDGAVEPVAEEAPAEPYVDVFAEAEPSGKPH